MSWFACGFFAWWGVYCLASRDRSDEAGLLALALAVMCAWVGATA